MLINTRAAIRDNHSCICVHYLKPSRLTSMLLHRMNTQDKKNRRHLSVLGLASVLVTPKRPWLSSCVFGLTLLVLISPVVIIYFFVVCIKQFFFISSNVKCLII